MATATKVGEPARVGRWGLTVDSMTNPAEYVITKYPDDGQRHSDPFEIVCRIPYLNDPIGALVETGIPKGTASTLRWRVAMKLASPKAADTDLGDRPVS
jgi:hypothetical protein